MYKPSMASSAKDQPGHTVLKFRRGAQAPEKDTDALKASLLEKELKHLKVCTWHYLQLCIL